MIRDPNLLKQRAIDETKQGGQPLSAIAYAILYLAETIARAAPRGG